VSSDIEASGRDLYYPSPVRNDWNLEETERSFLFTQQYMKTHFPEVPSKSNIGRSTSKEGYNIEENTRKKGRSETARIFGVKNQ
jgi:hypothetical protein